MKNLTNSEKKELKNWAKLNSIDLSYNKDLTFGGGFWKSQDIADLKAALLKLEDGATLRSAARIAVGVDNIAYDVVAVIGNKNGFELISFEGKEVWVKSSQMTYVNGYLAIKKELFN